MSGELDLLLINPPYERLKGFSFASLPNGILGLATHVVDNGFKALVYDADTNLDDGILAYNNKNRAESQDSYADKIDNDEYYVWQEVRDTIKRLNPRFVGITLMTPTLHSGIKIAKIARDLGKTILIGGPHVNIIREKIFMLDCFDYVFFGEAEKSVVEFLKMYPDRQKLANLRGIGFKDDGQIVNNQFSERVGDLDTLPFPRRELLIYRERYLNTDLSTIMASRGCPYNCTFCSSVPIWGRKTVFRSPWHIVAEIKYLHDVYKLREFRFLDDTFTVKKSNLIDFCKLLIETFGERYFSWWCLSRINAIDENVLYWLKKAGCEQIQLGIESGSEKVLKMMQKSIAIDQVEKAVSLSKKFGFWVHTFFMIGLPYETLEDMKMTMDFIRKIKPDSVNLCTFTPHPGTELYNYCVANNLLEHSDGYELYKYIGHHSTSNFFLKDISKEDYQKVLGEILELTTRVNNTYTYTKLKYRIRNFTMDKLKRRLKVHLRNFSAKHFSGKAAAS